VRRQEVQLTEEERERLQRLVSSGTAAARELSHARVLLKADSLPAGPGWSDERIAEALEVSGATVERIRARYGADGLEAALHRRPQRGKKPCKLDGKQEAHLIALACGAPPDGQQRWTLRLLAEQFVTLEVGEPISDETVRQVLKKHPEGTRSSPGGKRNGVSRRKRMRSLSIGWRTCWTSTPDPTTHSLPKSVSMS